MDNKDFYTFSEYMKKEDNMMSASMEDYLEMIYRLSRENGFTRIHELSDALNVQPPSATKMVQRLSELKMLNYEKYGVIVLQDKGKETGSMLLDRHNTIEKFLRILGVDEDSVLEQTEKIEHTISRNTLLRFKNFIHYCDNHSEIAKELNKIQ